MLNKTKNIITMKPDFPDRLIKSPLFGAAFLLVVLFPATAQPAGSIVAGADSTESRIIVKWFSEQVIFPQGVHVYRSEAGHLAP
jgi:hypothetical protein